MYCDDPQCGVLPHRVPVQLVVVLVLGPDVRRDLDVRGLPNCCVQPIMFPHAVSPRPREEAVGKGSQNTGHGARKRLPCPGHYPNCTQRARAMRLVKVQTRAGDCPKGDP